MRVLVVGSGGREHALIRKIKESSRVDYIACCPGNGGISYDAECFDVGATDIDGVVELAKKIKADFVVVAPDDPLVLGMVDALNEAGFATSVQRQMPQLLKVQRFSQRTLWKSTIFLLLNTRCSMTRRM